MAISSVVTRGFGNGTYDPGVSLVPTRGYASSAEVSVDPPYRVMAFDVFIPGADDNDFLTHVPGASDFETHSPGAEQLDAVPLS